MEQLPHSDAARHTLVSRLLTKYLCQVTPSYHFCYKYSPWKYSGVQTENPQQVDDKVFSQGKQEEVVLEEERRHGLSLHEGRMWTRKEKEE